MINLLLWFFFYFLLLINRFFFKFPKSKLSLWIFLHIHKDILWHKLNHFVHSYVNDINPQNSNHVKVIYFELVHVCVHSLHQVSHEFNFLFYFLSLNGVICSHANLSLPKKFLRNNLFLDVKFFNVGTLIFLILFFSSCIVVYRRWLLNFELIAYQKVTGSFSSSFFFHFFLTISTPFSFIYSQTWIG